MLLQTLISHKKNVSGYVHFKWIFWLTFISGRTNNADFLISSFCNLVWYILNCAAVLSWLRLCCYILSAARNERHTNYVLDLSVLLCLSSNNLPCKHYVWCWAVKITVSHLFVFRTRAEVSPEPARPADSLPTGASWTVSDCDVEYINVHRHSFYRDFTAISQINLNCWILMAYRVCTFTSTPTFYPHF